MTRRAFDSMTLRNAIADMYRFNGETPPERLTAPSEEGLRRAQARTDRTTSTRESGDDVE